MATGTIKANVLNTDTPVSSSRLFSNNKLRIFRAAGVTVGSNGLLCTLGSSHYPPISVNNNCLVLIGSACYPGYISIGTDGKIDAHYFTSMGGANTVVPSGASIFGELVWFVS